MQDTVLKLLSNPPNAKLAFWVPVPAKYVLACDKAPPVDHDEPSYSSVHDNGGGDTKPPNATAAFCSPAPAKPFLAVIKVPPADHDVPLYSSVQDNALKSA